MAGTVTAGQRLTADLLGVPAWSQMTLGNGWTNAGSGSVNAQYRLWKLTNSVEVIGVISGGTVTTGTQIATLPNAPASLQPIPVQIQNSTGAATVDSPRMNITTGGALLLYNTPSGTTEISFHAWYSLDA